MSHSEATPLTGNLSDQNPPIKATTDPWLDRFVTAIVVTLIACAIVATTSGNLEAEENVSATQYRPFCKVFSTRYSHNIRVLQTSLGEPTQKWAPQECIATTKEEIDAYGAPDAILAVRLDVQAHPNRSPILGFGGAFTEASARNFQSLSKEGQDTVLELLFGQLGYNIGRVHINSCDFSLKSYAYDTVDGDFDLHNFSIDHDVQSGMLDMMQRAKQVYSTHWNGTNFKLYASPWSPPAWMKAPTPDDDPHALHAENMTNSAQPTCLRDGVGPDSPYAKAWALYFAKFLASYHDRGLDFFAVTIQNEPEFPAPWEACSYTPETQAAFLANHLGPQLAASFPNTKILIFDHNKDHAPVWIDSILKNKAAAKYVSGTAYHWYAGSTDRLLDGAQGAPNMHRVMAKLEDLLGTPNTHRHIVLGSEACHCPTTGYAGGDIAIAWARAERYAHSILADLAAGSQGWVEWNLLLDSIGGPNHLGNLCDASLLAVPHRATGSTDPPTLDFEQAGHPFGRVVGDGRTREELHALGFPADLLDKGVVAQPLFYYVGHISRYVRPGSSAVPALVEQSSRGQTFRSAEGITGGGQNNLARHGVEITVWPCEGSTRQQFVWDKTTYQLQMFGHDWLGIPTISCIGGQIDKDFLGVMTGSCNATDGFAGMFDILTERDGSDDSVVKIALVNEKGHNTQSCLVVQKLHNEGGAYGPRGGAQVAIGKCSSDAALWKFNQTTGEILSSYLGDDVCMTTGWPFLQVGAFDTPSQSAISEKVVVVLNEAAQTANYVLKDGANVVMAGSIPPHSIQTILID
jgi:glucosylceramidase